LISPGGIRIKTFFYPKSPAEIVIAVKAPRRSTAVTARAIGKLLRHLPSITYTAKVIAMLKCPPLNLPVRVAATKRPRAATDASLPEQLIPTKKRTMPKYSNNAMKR
jgi:hypothetical protein